MLTARDLMKRGAQCARTTESLVDVARRMRMLDVASLPVCDGSGRLHGMVTYRDIVVGCVAAGCDPAHRQVGDLLEGEPAAVDADASVEQALRVMMRADVRRLPVVEGDTMVGTVDLADLAMSLPEGSEPAGADVPSAPAEPG